MAKLKEIPQTPQTNETWLCGIREFSGWVQSPTGGPPYRPFIGLVVGQTSQMVLGQEMWPVHPTPDAVLLLLQKAMLVPNPPGSESARPGRIHFNDDQLADQLRAQLSSWNIETRSFPALPLVDDILRMMSDHFADEGYGGGFPSLVRIPGIEEPELREYFRAAADFARKKPWRWISDSQPIAVRFPATGRERYLSIMGHGGETFGVATYENLESLALIYSGAPPQIAVRHGPLLSVILDEAETMAFPDLDAITFHNWPVTSPRTYPAAVKFDESEDVVILDRDDLAFLSACLRVLPDFVNKHLRTPKGLRAEARNTFALSAPYQHSTIELSFPVDMDSVDQGSLLKTTLGMVDELNTMLDSGLISLADLGLDQGQLSSIQLRNFIDEWIRTEADLPLAMEIGEFMLEFADDMWFEEQLAETTVDEHMDNAWHIGRMLVQHGQLTEFSPEEIFSKKPMFVDLFRYQVSSAKTRLASYERTWRKLGRFARDFW